LAKSASDSSTRYGTIKDSSKLSSELFPSHILSYNTPQVLQLYRYAGVSVISRSSYFKETLLPNASELHTHLPNPVEQDLFEMMSGITLLLDEDRNFGHVLKDFSFVPNGVSLSCDLDDAQGESEGARGDCGGGRRLFKPCELFDPDVHELDRLLDPSFFPSAEFQREDVLVHLRTVGLHSTLDWTGVIACAKSIESMAAPLSSSDVDENQSQERRSADDKHERDCEDEHSSLSPRQERGACLFQYLIKNMGRLVGETSTNAKKRPSMFSLRGLFTSDHVEKVDTFTIEKSIHTLLRIAWVPVHQTPLDLFMPWPEGSSGVARHDVAAPIDCRPSSDAWWCSSSRYLALLPAQVAVMSKTFTWDTPLPITVIAKQLRDIAAKYEDMKGRRGEENDSTKQAVTEADLQNSRETLSALIPVLYQRLNSVGINNFDDQKQIVSILRSHPWIWVGDHFVHPNRVAFSATLSLTPYLYAIPQDLAVYSTLLNLFDVKESFTARDYVAVLHQMAGDTGAISSTASDNTHNNQSQKALSDAQIDMAVSLVTLLSAEGGGGGGEGSFRALDHTIYVPDHLGKLAVAATLVADDVPWMNGAEYASTRAGIRLCHPHISSKVASRVGVKSLRQMLVDRSVETLFVEEESAMHPSKGIVEAFGPSESLTGRLRTILDMYPDGNPIFSELIQNADDAGATVVRIMIDENTYQSESLMDPSVSALQGPALLFYNDATFKEADFRSLARIGQGSKLEKLSTTGRFGLGFNSVYHLTDTPSFVSGEHLVVFDPHTSYMPGTTPSQPGLRMKYCGNNLSNTFPDQFRPYEYFGCDFKQAYSGTLFRFPFRNASMARKSEISKRSYCVADVNVLLEQLSGELSQYLIFLRSVCAIEIYRLPENSTVPVLLQRAQSSVSNATTYNDQSLLQYFEKVPVIIHTPVTTASSSSRRTAAGPAAGPALVLSKDGFYTQLSSTPDNKLPTRVFHLTVETLTPLPSAPPSSPSTGQDLSSSASPLRAHPATSRSCVEYLVVTGLRGGSAKQLACNPKMRHLKLVPVLFIVLILLFHIVIIFTFLLTH
jgi:sacsin